jgi:hypothetical protein
VPAGGINLTKVSVGRVAGGSGVCVCAGWGWWPVDLGQFVPAGGINLTKISVGRAARLGVCRLGSVTRGPWSVVPAGGMNLTKIGKNNGDSVM